MDRHKHLLKFTAVLISLAVGASPAWATDYFVRPSGACANNGDGTAYSCAASPGAAGAWIGFSNVGWSSPLDGSSHTLFVAGTHTSVISRSSLNGTSNVARLKIYSCTTALGCGTDDAGVIDGGVEGANFTGTCFQLTDSGYLDINGLELKRSWSEKGLKVNSGCYDITFSSLSIHDNRDLGVGFNLDNPAVVPSNIILEDSTIYNNGSEGVYVMMFADPIIRNNTLYANGTGNSYFGSGTGANGEGDGIEIKPECTGAIVEGNTIYNPDYDGNTDVYAIHGYAEGTIIRNNYIHSLGTNEHGIKVGALAWSGGVGENITAMYIYNNLIVDDATPNASGIITRTDATYTSSGLQFLNNTIIGCTNGIRFSAATGTETTDAIVKNNIFSTPAGTRYAITLDSGVSAADSIAECDYNDVYDPDGTGTSVFSDAGTSRTFAGWQSTYSFDASSSQADPSLNGSYRATGDTPAGTSLSPLFTSDAAGVTRSVWTMGAYEYVTTGSISIGAGGSMTLGSGGTITLQ